MAALLPVARDFFFSSRRRHTRSLCDWSSDVCSSDLCSGSHSIQSTGIPPAVFRNSVVMSAAGSTYSVRLFNPGKIGRARVGKECMPRALLVDEGNLRVPHENAELDKL